MSWKVHLAPACVLGMSDAEVKRADPASRRQIDFDGDKSLEVVEVRLRGQK